MYYALFVYQIVIATVFVTMSSLQSETCDLQMATVGWAWIYLGLFQWFHVGVAFFALATFVETKFAPDYLQSRLQRQEQINDNIMLD